MATVIHVDGMMCSHCAGRVKKALEALPGVENAEVALSEKSVTVTGSADLKDMEAAIVAAGYQIIR